MIEIHIDEAKNLFTVCYHGHVTAEETAAWVEPMRLALGKMRPGFGLLADLTDLQAMDPDCAPHIREVMDFANAHGIAAVVRYSRPRPRHRHEAHVLLPLRRQRPGRHC